MKNTKFDSLLILCTVILFNSTSSKLLAQFPDPPVPISISANWTLEKNQASASFGSSVAEAGDVNGDGYADVIVGAPLFDNGQTDEGAAFLYYGSAVGLSATPGWSMQSNQVGAQFGFSVSTAGDVNNDGYSDVIVGAPYYDNGQNDEGRAYLYLGTEAGLSESAIWIDESDSAAAYFGYDVNSAGDVNGDGFGDIILSAVGYDIWVECCTEINNAGMVFVYHGNASGMDNEPDFTVTNYNNEASYGDEVAGTGDVNGDGYDDIIIGASTNGWDAPGSAFLYHGSSTGIVNIIEWTPISYGESQYMGTSVASAGDVNGDGYDDVIVSAPGYDTWYPGPDEDIFVYYGGPEGLTTIGWACNKAEGNFGKSVASAGDVNGDGYSDIIVGSNYYSHGQNSEGAIFVYTGGPSGLPGTTSWVAESNQANAYFGSSVSGAGDINGDGYDDFMAGAWNYDNGQTDEGQVRESFEKPLDNFSMTSNLFFLVVET